MAENTVKKIATRESYGNALLELGAENPNVVVLDADLAAATKTGGRGSRTCHSRKDTFCQQLRHVCGRQGL